MRQARHEMDKFVQTVSNHPEKRENASPYYLLHEEGEAVYGTVLVFHGFSATTVQMSLLAQYLFESGFNVYQPALCGHYFLNPDKHWPKVYFEPLAATRSKLPESSIHKHEWLTTLILLAVR